jgi:hypothetical protein
MIWAAIVEVCLNTQAPLRMVIMCALAAFSTISQGLYDVRSPLGSLHALSLNILIKGLSGERKTTVDRYLTSVISSFVSIINSKIDQANESVKSDLEKWELENAILKAAYKRAKRQGESHAEEEALDRHQALKPQELDFLAMIHDDFTMSALLYSLCANMPVASIVTSEGAKVLDDANMKNIPFLNKLWDGGPVQVSRISRESFWLEDPRLSTAIMIQPDVADKIISKRHDELRSSGYFSRALFCYPLSNIGKRHIGVTKQYDEKIKTLNARLGVLCIDLLMSLSNSTARKVLELDQEAEQLWLDFANHLESQMGPGGIYHSATDLASKMAENALRVAGTLHAIEFGDGPISSRTLGVAIEICVECSKDFLSCFVPPPQDVVDGQRLHKYLWDNFVVYMSNRSCDQLYFDERFIRRNRVLQCGPLTKAAQINQALSYLIRQNVVRVLEEIRPKGRGVVYIDLCPDGPFPQRSPDGFPLRHVPM